MKADASPHQETTVYAEKIKKMAEEIVSSLVESNKDEAIAVLSASMYIVAVGGQSPKDIFENSGRRVNPHLVRRRRGGVGPFETDPELKAYVLGVDRYLSITKMHDALVKKFGKQRTPSRSSIHRFLQRVTRTE